MFKEGGKTYAVDIEFVDSLQLNASSDESRDVDRQFSTLASASAIYSIVRLSSYGVSPLCSPSILTDHRDNNVQSCDVLCLALVCKENVCLCFN